MGRGLNNSKHCFAFTVWCLRWHADSLLWGVCRLYSVSVVIAVRKRPVPFRTRKLSSHALMVLHSGGCGRVGRCRT